MARTSFMGIDLPDTSHLKSKKSRFRKWWEDLPNHKRYWELIAAILSIPVLVTVIILNAKNLQSAKEEKRSGNPTIVITQTEKGEKSTVPTSAACKKEIGPISITYPKEGQEVDDNPVNIIIRYDNEEYCSVVWSYRINKGDWSPYTSNSISLFNLESGDIKLELRVQSTVSDDQTQLERNFVYSGQSKSNPSPTTTPAPTETP